MPKVKTQKKSRRSRQQEEVYTVEKVVDKRLNNGRVSLIFKNFAMSHSYMLLYFRALMAQ